MPRKTGLISRSLCASVLFAAAGCAAFAFLACAGSGEPKSSVALNLDSLNQVVERNDSVESNTIFYEEAYTEYRKRYPGVDKSAYLHIAKGKDQEFCLFKANPAKTCQETGDKFNDLNLKPPALDAYNAGLLSEAYNDSSDNIRLWGSMGQLAIEEKNYDEAKSYLAKVLEVDPKNKWAKGLLATIPKTPEELAEQKKAEQKKAEAKKPRRKTKKP